LSSTPKPYELEPRSKLVDRSVPGERYYVEDKFTKNSLNKEFYAEGSVNSLREELSISMRTEVETLGISERSTLLRGAEQFQMILKYFEGKFTSIRGNWTFGSNLNTVNKLTGKGMLIEEAVTKTWTAEQARAAGYPKATIVGKPVGTPGNYTEVQVLFQK